MRKDVVGRALCVTERADDCVAPVDRPPYGRGARRVAADERDAGVDLPALRLLAHERRDLVADRERLSHDLAPDAAGRAEDGELARRA